RARKFIARRPRRQYTSMRVTRRNEAFGFLMQTNVVCVSEIVFRRKSIGRIVEECGHKAERCDSQYSLPEPQPSPDGRNTDQNDERHNWEHVTCEHSPA